MDKVHERFIAQYDKHCQMVAKATLILLGEKPADRYRRMKELEKDYIKWFEYYFPHYAKVKCARYHKRLANRIINNSKGKTLAEIYRSGGKSVHIDMGIPLFLMVTGQMKFMLLIGETADKAKQLLGDIQAELEFNQRFLNDYGRKFQKGDWADGDFYTSDGVRFKSLGFGQSPRGLREGAQRPDYIVVDDVDTKAHVNSDRIMGESVDFIMEEVMGCFDAADESNERFVYANNNFHKNSITNRLKKEFTTYIKADKEEGIATQYEIISVAAVKDLINFEPTWPEKTSADYWRRKYKKRPRSFMREYMHMHVQEGKIFKAEYFQWKEMLPLKKYDALFMYGDLSYKAQADYKAMILGGKIGREIHFIHVYVRQASRSDVAKWVYDLWEDRKLASYNVPIKIEGLFAMDEFVSDFDHEGDERGYHIPVVADKRSKADKHDRIESTEGYFQRHWVFFNEDERGHMDQVTLIDQYLAFEKGSQANDDGPDCGHAVIADLMERCRQDKFEPRLGMRERSEENDY